MIPENLLLKFNATLENLDASEIIIRENKLGGNGNPRN